MKKGTLFFSLLLSALPLAAQQPAPTPTSAVVATHSADAEPEQAIQILRAQIAAGRRELKASIKLEKRAERSGEAQVRLEIAQNHLQIVRRQNAARLAKAAK